MRIVIAGSSGFLGRQLAAAQLRAGHEVVRLVRRPPGSTDEVQWDPRAGELAPDALAGAAAVVNLAGANVGTRPWTERYKRVLVASRVDTTATLGRTMAALPPADRPPVFLAQSATHFYGNPGDRVVTEDDPPGEGFLTEVVKAWEAATRPAEDAGVRVVRMRTGLPLSAGGGLLQPMVWQFRLFAGGRMGSGRQYMPWISMTDWLRAVEFVRDRDDIAGPVNLVGPDPVRNAEFARTLGQVLGRPSFWPIPGLALRIVLDGFGGAALDSQRVMPAALVRAGFSYRHPDLESALRAALAG